MKEIYLTHNFNILFVFPLFVCDVLPKTAEKEEYEHQQKDLEKVCNPIITKLYQGTGGMPGGPGGFPGGAGGGSSSGPTIEEVD